MKKKKSTVMLILMVLLLFTTCFESARNVVVAAASPVITARINEGEVLSGTSLQDIVENQLKLEGTKVYSYEVLEGQLSVNDVTYMEDYLVPPNELSIVINEKVNVSTAFPDGFDMGYYDPGLKRIEMSGIKTIERVRFQDGIAMMSFPDAEVVNYGAFDGTGVETLFFKNLKEVGRYGFDASKLKQLILTGAQVPKSDDTAFRNLDSNATVWVPKTMVESYKAFDDGNTADGKWWGLQIQALPDGCTDLNSLLNHFIAKLPSSDQLSEREIETVDLINLLTQGVAYADHAAYVQKMLSFNQKINQIKVDQIKVLLNKIPALEEITAADQMNIEEVLTQFSKLTKEQQQMVLDQTGKDPFELAAKLYHVLGNEFVYCADSTMGYGNTIKEAVQYWEDKTGAYASDAKSLTLWYGNYDKKNANTLFKEFGYIEDLHTEDSINLNDGYISYQFFKALITTVRIDSPSIRHIQKNAEYDHFTDYERTFKIPNVVTIGSNNTFGRVDGFMPYLEEADSVLPVGTDAFRAPRLVKGSLVANRSVSETFFLPALKSLGREFFGNTSALKTVWLPQVEAIDGKAFTNSTVTSLIIENPVPPTVSGPNPFEGLNIERTVYVPTKALPSYQAVDDGQPEDGKWYGWQVAALEDSVVAKEMMAKMINEINQEIMTIDHYEWVSALERSSKALNKTIADELNHALSNALMEVKGHLQDNAVYVMDQIDALGAVEALTLEDEAKITMIREMFEALLPDAKAQVKNIDKLVAAEKQMEVLKIEKVHQGIKALPNQITEKDIPAVREAYGLYLELSETAQKEITETEYQKLSAAVDAILSIEKEISTVSTVQKLIESIPEESSLVLKDKEIVEAARAAYDKLSEGAKARLDGQILLKLQNAEKKIAELSQTQIPKKAIYLTVEKFALGQGFVVKPIRVELNEGVNLAEAVTEEIGWRRYKHTGSIENGFYLSGVLDGDRSEATIPQYIVDRVIAGGESISGRAKKDWLSEFDYTSMSGWMYALNNHAPESSMSDYTYERLKDGDVIRVQFSVYGYGRDIGLNKEENYITTANKDHLLKALADVDASADKLIWMEDAAYKTAYEQAYQTMQKLDASQNEVDAAVEALKNKPLVNSEGIVTVTVRDQGIRRQETTGDAKLEKTFQPLKGLGDYDEPFGVLIDQIKVPIDTTMSAPDAISKALELSGYNVEYNGNEFTSVGPVVRQDRNKVVAHLAKGDVGSMSQWVMSINNQAITTIDTDSYDVKDGDTLMLEYSVDGGYDIGCSNYAYTDPLYHYQSEVRGPDYFEGEIYLPEGTTELAVDIEPLNGHAPDQNNYSRYNRVWLEVDGNRIEEGTAFAVTEGTQLVYNYFCPPGSGEDCLIMVGDSEESPSSRVYKNKLTVVYFYAPDKMKAEIAKLPSTQEMTYADMANVKKLDKLYQLLTEEEKLQVGDITKLTDSLAQSEVLQQEIASKASVISGLIYEIPRKNNITLDTLADVIPLVDAARAAYDAADEYVKAEISSYQYRRLTDAEEVIYKLTHKFEAPLGQAFNYANDFMLSGFGFNLNLQDNPKEVVFFDVPRISENDQATNRSDLQITVKDPSVVEVRKEQLPNKNNPNELLDHYYLVPLKEGNTTIQVTYPGFEGQTPEMIVHVNSADESGLGTPENRLEDHLTNINEIARKYDTYHYQEGTDGADFTFKVNGNNVKVQVLKYLGEGSTDYVVDAEGNVHVKLTDGYNPIIVTADYNGKTVTQVYGVRAKAIRYEMTNKSRPEATDFMEGDIASLDIVGLNPSIYKISRIYNPSGTSYLYNTDMPRYDVLESGGGQYKATTMEFELTAAGDWTLTNGMLKQIWFGSPLYSELPTGSAPPNLNANQPKDTFRSLPDIKIHVAENPNYQPKLIQPIIEGGTTVKAGTTVKMFIQDLDIDRMKREHTTTSQALVNDIFESVTQFKTDIPGLEKIRSENGEYKAMEKVDSMNKIKEISFTIPEDTKPGTYHLTGGYVDMTYGVSFWLKYMTYHKGEIADMTLEVLPSDKQIAADCQDLINQLPDTVTLADQAQVDAAAKAFDALTEAQKAFITETQQQKLNNAKETIANLIIQRDQEAAAVVDQAIEALGAVESLNQQASVEAVRAAYEALTSEQKAYVQKLPVLEDAEAKIEILKQQALDQEAARPVVDMIAALGTIESLDQETIVQAARNAYDKLTEAQKLLVDNVTVLEQAEAKIAQLKLEKEALEQHRAEALEALRSYKNSEAYREPEKSQLQQMKLDGETAIAQAETIEAVDAALATAQAQMDTLKTDLQYLEEAAASVKALIEKALKAIDDNQGAIVESCEQVEISFKALEERAQILVKQDLESMRTRRAAATDLNRKNALGYADHCGQGFFNEDQKFMMVDSKDRDRLMQKAIDGVHSKTKGALKAVDAYFVNQKDQTYVRQLKGKINVGIYFENLNGFDPESLEVVIFKEGHEMNRIKGYYDQKMKAVCFETDCLYDFVVTANRLPESGESIQGNNGNNTSGSKDQSDYLNNTSAQVNSGITGHNRQEGYIVLLSLTALLLMAGIVKRQKI